MMEEIINNLKNFVEEKNNLKKITNKYNSKNDKKKRQQ